MDPTIIAAIIAGGCAIIAAVIAALLQKKWKKEEPSEKPQKNITVEGDAAVGDQARMIKQTADGIYIEKAESPVVITQPPPTPVQEKPTLPAEIPSPPPPIVDIAKLIKEEVEKLSLGQILFNPPEEMTVGVKERVEVRITQTIIKDLSRGLRGRGVPQIEEIKVGTFMEVRLTGDNFDIKTLSHEEQIVASEGFTQWDWDVTPLKSGIQLLLLTVTVRIIIPNYGEEKKDYPVFEREIKVKVNPIYSTMNFIKSYWRWIISTIIGSGIIGWIIKKWCE